MVSSIVNDWTVLLDLYMETLKYTTTRGQRRPESNSHEGGFYFPKITGLESLHAMVYFHIQRTHSGRGLYTSEVMQ